MIFWVKYGTQADIRFPMVKRGVVDLAVSADWTPAAADCAISKDGGNYADATNTVAIVGGTPTRSVAGWKLTLSATELQCAELDIQIVDAATKAVEDQFITVYTYGNASAKFAGDWSDLVRLGLTALPNVAAGANGGLPTIDANLEVKASTLRTNNDKTGYALSAAGVQAIWDALTSALTTASSIGKLLVDNINATISSRMATFTLPTNFSALSITAGGLVDITQTAADKVWSSATRTLTSFGTLVADIWANATRTLTSFGTLAADVWASATRTLTSGANIALAKGTGVTGFTDLDATGVRTAVGLASANLDTQLDALPTASENAAAVWANSTRTLTGSQGVKKNTALANFMFRMTDSTNHAPTTGLTVTAQRSLDGAAFGACANSVTEVGSGWYKINLAAGDLNGDTVALKLTATGADQLDISIVTSP